MTETHLTPTDFKWSYTPMYFKILLGIFCVSRSANAKKICPVPFKAPGGHTEDGIPCQR